MVRVGGLKPLEDKGLIDLCYVEWLAPTVTLVFHGSILRIVNIEDALPETNE